MSPSIELRCYHPQNLEASSSRRFPSGEALADVVAVSFAKREWAKGDLGKGTKVQTGWG
jgi:hypothetical protein